MSVDDDHRSKFILSFDFEIGWGDVTNSRWVKREKNGVYKKLRFVLKNLLSELDMLEIPTTWATVGAMIDEPGDLILEHLPQQAKNIVDFALKSAGKDSFDGRDLFEMLLSSKVKHSVASHSYSHIPFNYNGVNEQFVRADLELSLKALAKYGIDNIDRYVFPENREGYYHDLADGGIKVVRVGANIGNIPRYKYLLSTLVNSPPAGKSDLDPSGIVRRYGSMLFNMRAGKYYRLPFIYLQALRGLTMAYEEKKTFHVWSHPFNFAESSAQLTAFKLFLRRVAAYRDSGKITVSII